MLSSSFSRSRRWYLAHYCCTAPPLFAPACKHLGVAASCQESVRKRNGESFYELFNLQCTMCVSCWRYSTYFLCMRFVRFSCWGRAQESLVDTNWAEIADHIETIEELYEVSDKR